MYNALESFFLYYSKQPFEWGKVDCCIYSANVVKYFTGKDYAEKYRGKYSSELGFKKLLIKHNFKDLKELVVDALGEPKPGYKARKGEPVLLKENGEYIVGICFGHFSLFLTKEGLVKRTNDLCLFSWSLECLK